MSSEYRIALQWINGKPIIDGCKAFSSKEKCFEFISLQPKVDCITWTLPRVEIIID